VQFPPDAVAHLRQVLAEGHNAESRRRQAERAQESKLTSARATNAAIVRKSEIALQRLADLRRDPEAFQAWFQDLDRNWAIYEAEIERDTLRAELESQRAALAEQQLTQQAEALRPQMRQTLEQQVGRMIAGEADLQGLDALQAVERLWGTFFDRVFVEAAQDDPHGRYRRGEILIDYDAIRAELQYEAKVRGAGKTPPPPVAAPVPPKPPVTPPPVVSSKGAGGRPTPKVPKFKTTEDADRWFDEGGYNEL
jgi:exonuclease VII large subunit